MTLDRACIADVAHAIACAQQAGLLPDHVRGRLDAYGDETMAAIAAELLACLARPEGAEPCGKRR